MKKSMFLLLVLFISSFVDAQIPNWNWGYNYGAFNSDTRGITATSANGDVYLVSNFLSPTLSVGATVLTNTGAVNTGEIYIVKYNSSGTLLWVKKEGGLQMDSVTSIATDSSGNFYLLGNFVSQITIGTTILTHPFNGPFLVKYDAQGTVIWTKRIGTASDSCVPNKIKVDPSGNVYMTGYYTSSSVTFDTVVLTTTNYDPNVGGNSFVAKYDTNGNVVWAKGTQRTGTTVFNNISYDIAFDVNGNVFIGGTFFSSTMQFDTITLTNSASPSTTMFIAKYDANGTVQWAKTPVSTNPNHYLTAISTDALGNAYFSGTFRGTMLFDSVSLSASSSGGKLFTVKYNSNGVAQWAKTATSNGFSNIDSSDVDAAGNLYVTGTFSDTAINFGNGISGFNSGVGGLFVVKYSSTGTPQWIRTAGSLNINSRISIDCLNENEIYIAGYFNNATLTLGGITLTKNTPSNEPDSFIAKLFYQPLSSATFIDTNFEVAPNPVDDVAYINNVDGNFNYLLTDVTGKKIVSGQLHSSANFIPFKGFSAGLYFLEIQNDEGAKVYKRIIKK